MDKLSLTKSLESYVNRLFKNVTRNSDWLNFSCPVAPWSVDHKFKEDKSPSCGVVILDNGKTYVKCFTCKYQGSFPQLLTYLSTKQKNINYQEIIEQFDSVYIYPDYEDRFLPLTRKVCEPLPFQNNMFEPVENYSECSKYLADRGVSLTTAHKLGLGYDPDAKRVVFPVKDAQGLVYGYTGRTVLPEGKPKILDYYFPKSMFILGTELWTDQPSVIVEGLFAYAHLHEITKGKIFPYNIGAIMGSSISPDQVSILIQHGRPIYCLLDNDAAGQTGMYGKRPHADWSPEKKALERSKGLIFQTAQHIPTLVMKWPNHEVEGKTVPKVDPDDLTYDELCDMILNPRLILTDAWS